MFSSHDKVQMEILLSFNSSKKLNCILIFILKTNFELGKSEDYIQ